MVFTQQKTNVLTEVESRDRLKKYNINQNKYIFVNSLDQVIYAANQLNYPLVMKVVSKQIVHKSEFGGVQINLRDENDVIKAYNTIFENAAKHGVDESSIDGVLIQEMVTGIEEIMVGVKRDSVFGPVMVIGFGGIFVELIQDVELGICPLQESDIYRMLNNLKGFPLLNGYRGRKKANLPAIVDLIKKVQSLMLLEDDIVEMDLNPIIAQEDSCVVVDARMVIQQK